MVEFKDRRCIFCNWLNKEVRENFVCKNCIKENSGKNVPVVQVEEEVEWYKKLTKIRGIGSETAKDIGEIYSSLNDLKQALINNRVPLRNDVVDLLKSNLIK